MKTLLSIFLICTILPASAIQITKETKIPNPIGILYACAKQSDGSYKGAYSVGRAYMRIIQSKYECKPFLEKGK